MLEGFDSSIQVRSILKIAFVLFVSVGSLRSNVCCTAFSAIGEDIVRTRQPSSLSRVLVGGFIGASPIQNLREQSILVSGMSCSDENDEKVTTIGTDADDADRSPSTDMADKAIKSSPPFDEDVWKAYESVMEGIMEQKRVIKKCDDESISKCREFLLSFDQHISPVPDIVDIVSNGQENNKETLELSLRQQSQRFKQLFNFTGAQIEYINRCLVYMGDACAKLQSKKNGKTKTDDNSASSGPTDPRLPIAVAWQKLKEMGYVIRENSMSTYMYILSNSAEGETKNDAFVDDTLLEVVTCHDTIYKPSEKTVTIRLKSLIARGKIDEAEDMFTSSFNGGGSISSVDSAIEESKKSKENTQGRLRTYMPLMEYYCMNGNLTSTLRLYQQMQDCAGVHWDVESYSLLLSSLARFGFFFTDNNGEVHESTSADNEANNKLHGPVLFNTLASNMAKDILELTEKTSFELAEAFESGIKDYLVTPSSKKLLAKDVVVEKVEISKANGTCPVTDVKLRLLALDEMQRQHVHDTLLEMSRTTTEEFIASWKFKQQKPKKAKKPKIHDTAQETQPDMESYGYEELLKFSEWLDNREGDLYTTIVDGANVAYYGHSNVHYSSLKKVVEKLESMGERPLVVMPEKYTSKSWACRPNFYQKRTQKDEGVIEWLRENQMIYVVPRLNLDDYFWMLASVSNQTKATQRDDLSIPVGNDQGRFPGMRPMLITNDQMRDHKLDLLEPREFRRWCSCHIVNYDIAAYEKDEWVEEREISFVPADSFSREIQSNLHKDGIDTVWHFPVANSAEWLCIAIKT